MDYSSSQNYVSVIPPAGQNRDVQSKGFVTQQPQTQYGMDAGTVQGQSPNTMGVIVPEQALKMMGGILPGQMPNMIGEVNTIPIIITLEHFQPYHTTCPHCRSKIKTKVVYKVGGFTWFCGFIIGISGAPFACCIPCCMDSCKDATHHCPSCHKEILSYKRMECTGAKVAYFDNH